MPIRWLVSSPSEWAADAVIFFGFEDPGEFLPGLARWTAGAGAWLDGSPALKDFQGRTGQVVVCYGPPDSKIPRALLVGLGKADKFDMDGLREAAAGAARKCRELRLKEPALPPSAFEGLPFQLHRALREALVAALTGLYRFDELKTRDLEPAECPETFLLPIEREPAPALVSAALEAEALAAGIVTARRLVTSPSNRATPSYMVETAQRLARDHGFRTTIIDEEEALKLGMGAFAAVARGSGEPAYMIALEHCPPGREEESPIVLVGKGITFDTGGISLKSGQNLDGMKQDMAGAAAVLGALEVFGRLNVDRRVVGIMPCTENMPGGKAYKPGDVVRTLAGLTVEIISTDAEGRMALCDALTYSLRYKPSLIADIATLTGACVVALGHRTAGVMANRETLAVEIMNIGADVGEKFWRLPLWDFFFDNLKSDVADFKNVGDRTAGAIVAGKFLQQFVPEEIPWAHLDIAGTAWTDKDLPTAPKGPTGFGVRTLVELVLRTPEQEPK